MRLLAGSRTPGSMQVARHSGEAPRRRGWAAEPSFRAFAPGGDSARRIDPREPQPGVNSLWGKPVVGETGFPPQAPSSADGEPQRARPE